MKVRSLTPDESQLVEDALLRAGSTRPYYTRALAALDAWAAPGVGTVAVDKFWRLYIDPEWFAEQTEEHRANVFSYHEVEHLLRDHDGRRGERIPQLHVVAGDLEINDDAPEGALPEGCLHPAKWDLPANETAEFYYDKLEEELDEFEGSCGGGSGAGDPQEWELEPTSDTMTPEQADTLRDLVAQDVIEHQKRYGDVPAGALIWAEARLKPVPVDWRRLLANIVGRKARELVRGREDYSFARLNRRSRPMVPLRPGMIRPEPNIGIVTDTSGSMTREGSSVLSVVDSICRCYGSVLVWQVDTELKDKPRRRPAHYLGGGGTSLQPGVDAAEKWADVTLVVTDAICPPVQHKRPLVAVVVGEAEAEWADRVVRVS